MWSKWKKLKLLLSKRICIISPLKPADQVPGGCRSGAEEEHHSHRSGRGNNDVPEGTGGRRKPTFSRSITEPIILYDQEPAHTQTVEAPSFTHSGPISASTDGKTNGVRISRSTCAICLEAMKPGCGQALFTAECSHTFHFSCIVSNVKYGNQICPVCRAKWKDVPWQVGIDGSKCQRSRSSSHRRAPSALPYFTPDTRQADVSVGRAEGRRRHNFQFFSDNAVGEPEIYDDDEPRTQPNSSSMHRTTTSAESSDDEKVRIKTYTEVSAVPGCESHECFTVLVHLKAPSARIDAASAGDEAQISRPSRAPIDLVAVLDVSGSMAGRKLALLKQAMGFVVRNLSSSDRLSVVVFSSTARRIFPLQRMGEEGQRQLLQVIDGLFATGGTNIAEGLRKGVKVLEDRKEQNPVSSIMLLSDGQDTYNMSSRRQLPLFPGQETADSRRFVPRSIRRTNSSSSGLGQVHIPVHTFGFGSDHDAATMHSISEASGGTFSFIQTEEVVQDAFAQCIGGLLTVVVQDVQLVLNCSTPGVLINEIHAGSYESNILDSGRHGMVKLGDLYAEEERDVLVNLTLPAFSLSQGSISMSLLQAACIFKDSVTQEMNQSVAEELSIDRPFQLNHEQQVVSLEVDRQRNRLRTAQAIAEARSLADQGDIEAAQSGLQNAKALLGNSASAQAGDHLCTVLESELNAIQERMATRHIYERSGRAYLLSAQSSHLRQRATTRGDSVDGLMHDYQTPSMVDMVTLSQTRSPAVVNTLPQTNSRNASGSNHSSGRSLLRRASAKVLRSHV